MNQTTILFISLVSATLGMGILAFIIYAFWRKRKTIKGYAAQVLNQQNVDETASSTIDTFLRTALSASSEEVKTKFDDAGVYNFKYYYLYMPVKYAVALLGSLIITALMYGSSENANIIAVCAIYLVAIILVPDFILNAAKEALNRKIRDQLPYLLDLLAVCVQTGLTLEASLAYLAKELKSFDKDLSRIVGQLSERSNFVGLDRALEELYDKYPSNEMRSFVMTLRQSIKYGSSIYEILVRLSSDIRQLSMLTVEEKIGKLSAKMSVPLILFIMFPIVILIVAPGIMRMLG